MPPRRPRPQEQPLATPLDEYLLPQYQQRAPVTPRQQPGPDPTAGAGQAPATAPQPEPDQPPQASAQPNPDIQPDTALDEDGELDQWLGQQAAAGEQANAQAVQTQRVAIPPTPGPVKVQPDTQLADAQQRDRISGLIGGLAQSVNTMIGNHRADAAFAQMTQPGTSARDVLARRAAEQQQQQQAQAEQDTREQTDPASATNRRYQAVLQDRFPDIDPEVLGNITVKDVQTNGLLNSMASARERSETLAQQLGAQQAMLDDRQQGAMDLAQYNQGEQNARNEANNAAALERAKLRGHRGSGTGGAGAGSATNRASQLEAIRASTRALYTDAGERVPQAVETVLGGLTAEDMRSPGKSAMMAQLKFLTRNRDPQFVDRQVSELSKRISSSGAVETIEQGTDVANMIEHSNDADFGIATNAPNWYRAVMMSERAADLKAAINAFQNMVLKNQSGQAVTDAEFSRLQQQLQTGALTTKAAVVHAIHRMVEIQRSKLSTIQSGYGTGVVNRVNANRGAASSSQTGTSFTPPNQDGKIKVFDHQTNREYWITAQDWQQARQERDAHGNPVVERR